MDRAVSLRKIGYQRGVIFQHKGAPDPPFDDIAMHGKMAFKTPPRPACFKAAFIGREAGREQRHLRMLKSQADALQLGLHVAPAIRALRQIDDIDAVKDRQQLFRFGPHDPLPRLFRHPRTAGAAPVTPCYCRKPVRFLMAIATALKSKGREAIAAFACLVAAGRLIPKLRLPWLR